ncbi:hypothetical protein Ga0466249_005405 [Sporomusaceae bacterium BoRhaA]|nr:hypothetical protein [Pelorhabdus rhamnosifermentans]
MMKWQRDHAVAKAAYEKLTAEEQAEKFAIGVLYESEAPEYTKEYDKLIEQAQGGAK